MARYGVLGLAFSGEALSAAPRLQPAHTWPVLAVQADLVDPLALEAAGLSTGPLARVLAHLCFCALDPALRQACLSRMKRLLLPGGWPLGLF